MHILQSSLSFSIPSMSCSSEDTPGCALATDGPGFSGETSLLVVSLGKNSPIPAKSVRHDHTYWLLMQNSCIIVNLWYFLLLFFKFKISGDCSKCDTAGNMKATRILVYAWDDCLVLPELHTCCTLLTMKNIKRPLTYDQNNHLYRLLHCIQCRWTMKNTEPFGCLHGCCTIVARQFNSRAELFKAGLR